MPTPIRLFLVASDKAQRISNLFKVNLLGFKKPNLLPTWIIIGFSGCHGRCYRIFSKCSENGTCQLKATSPLVIFNLGEYSEPLGITFEFSEIFRTGSGRFFYERCAIGFGAIEPRTNRVFTTVTERRITSIVRQAVSLNNVAEYVY